MKSFYGPVIKVAGTELSNLKVAIATVLLLMGAMFGLLVGLLLTPEDIRAQDSWYMFGAMFASYLAFGVSWSLAVAGKQARLPMLRSLPVTPFQLGLSRYLVAACVLGITLLALGTVTPRLAAPAPSMGAGFTFSVGLCLGTLTLIAICHAGANLFPQLGTLSWSILSFGGVMLKLWSLDTLLPHLSQPSNVLMLAGACIACVTADLWLFCR